jgi:hypothetical protein
MVELEGRLEKATLTATNPRSSLLFGYLPDSEYKGEVMICGFNGRLRKYKGHDCLIRFDFTNNSKDENSAPLANFISDKIPDNFEGLAHEEFILYGEWNPSWTFAGKRVPSLEGINHRYNPGKMGRVIYLSNNGLRNLEENFTIAPHGRVIKVEKSISQLMDYTCLTTNHVNPRVFLVETQRDERLLREEAERCNLVPIRMTKLSL